MQGKEYTPQDNLLLFQDAGLDAAADLATYYTGLVKIDASAFPNVDVYAEKGSGLDTVVGAELGDLTVGQVLGDSPVFFTRDGDANQEDITNDAIAGWKDMPCFRFELTDNPGVDHFALPGDEGVLERLVGHLRSERSVCP